ncbi:MAG: chemotaxis protein CheW [Phycisphaerales bacterium]
MAACSVESVAPVTEEHDTTPATPERTIRFRCVAHDGTDADEPPARSESPPRPNDFQHDPDDNAVSSSELHHPPSEPIEPAAPAEHDASARAPFGPLVDSSVLAALGAHLEAIGNDLRNELRDELVRLADRLDLGIRGIGDESSPEATFCEIADELRPLAEFFDVDELRQIADRVDELARRVADNAVAAGDAALQSSAVGLASVLRGESSAPDALHGPATFTLPMAPEPAAAIEEAAEGDTPVPTEIDPSASTDPMTPTIIDTGMGVLPDTPLPEEPVQLDPSCPAETGSITDPAGAEGPIAIDADDIQAMLMGLDGDWGSRPLDLSNGRGERLQAMVADLRDCVAQLAPAIADAQSHGDRDDAASAFAEVQARLLALNAGFEFKTLEAGARLLGIVVSGIATVPDALFPEFEVRLRSIAELLEQFVGGLEVAMELTWPIETLERRLGLLAAGQPLHPDLIGWHRGEPERVLELDGVTEGIEDPPKPASDAADAAAPLPTTVPASPAVPVAGPRPNTDAGAVRVPRPTIESLVNTVRQLVLNKNQLVDIAETLRSERTPSESIELLSTQTTELDRLLGELRECVSGTRMQAFDRVFDRLERYTRDTSRLNDREASLTLEGGDTLIDKFTLDQLVEPLTRILRVMITESIEQEPARAAAGKSPAGRIEMRVRDLGGQLLVRLVDDGAGGPIAEAFEPDQREAIEPGGAVAELGGIAVSLGALGGKLSAQPTPAGGLEATLLVPIDGAVIPAMLVVIAGEQYAIPLANVVEIVRIDRRSLGSVGRRPVLRLRESVLGVLDARESLTLPDDYEPGGIAVVIQAGADAAVLRVERVIGQREIVLEKLDRRTSDSRVFSGATIRSDGGISLVIDAASLIGSELVSVAQQNAPTSGA